MVNEACYYFNQADVLDVTPSSLKKSEKIPHLQ